jgi:hypothetical protein
MAEVPEAAEMVDVDSTNLAQVGFIPYSDVPESAEKDTGTLYVRFHASKRDVAAGLPGALWAFPGVPSLVHGEFVYAASVGTYFNKNIRDSYPGKRIS